MGQEEHTRRIEAFTRHQVNESLWLRPEAMSW